MLFRSVKYVVVQRGLRLNETIRWGGQTLQLVTPWTFYLVQLKPSARGFVRSNERLFVSNGPGLGASTPLFSSVWLGNIYNNHGICWGTVVLSGSREVTLPTLTNIVNDFYLNGTFTPDLERSPQRWQTFSDTGRIPGPTLFTLDEALTRFKKGEL